MKNKTKEDIKQICTYFSPDLVEGTCGYSLTEEQFNKLFEYLDKNFVEKPKTKEIKADWEQKLEELFDWVGYFGEDSNAFKEMKNFIKKNFVAKGEVREMVEDFVDSLILELGTEPQGENKTTLKVEEMARQYFKSLE